MNVATHLIKIKGIAKDGKKKENQLKDYVKDKIYTEIDSIYHPDLELFHVDEDGTIEVWAYVSGFGVTKRIIEQWLQDHIKEEGIEIKSLEIEKLLNEKFFVLTN